MTYTSSPAKNNTTLHALVTFTFSFVAIGCEKIIPPGGATIKGNENETTITCADGREFKLMCTDTEWSPPSASISCWRKYCNLIKRIG